MDIKSTIKRTLRYALSPFVIFDYFSFKKMKDGRFKYSFLDIHPSVKDKTVTTGFDRHYVYHTSWAVRKVKEINPEKHIDIGSTLFFCGTLSAFIPVDFYDYRPARLILSGLQSKHGDLRKLPFEDNSVSSISCMHTIEHIGLGRYGDPMDPKGDVKSINEIRRVLKPGGSFLYVTPMGKESVIEFNAHRIYSYRSVIEMLSGFEIKEFSLIHEKEKDGDMTINADPKLLENEHYACGCFWLIKK